MHESFMRVVFRGDEPQGRERIADFVGGGHEIGDLRVLGGPSPLTRRPHPVHQGDRKSTRLNSSHVAISYAVFCLKKKTMAQLYPVIRDTRHSVLYINQS